MRVSTITFLLRFELSPLKTIFFFFLHYHYQASDFKTFSSAGEIKGLMDGLKAKPGPRKIGEALEFYYPLYKAAKEKSGLKSVLFLFTNGVNKGDAKKLKEYGAKYRKLGTYYKILAHRTVVKL